MNILVLMPRWNLEALTSNQDKFDFAKFKRLLVAYAKENTALVTSFLSTPFTQIIGVNENTSVINTISSVGGLMGLIMGFTMVTLAEIIYLVPEISSLDAFCDTAAVVVVGIGDSRSWMLSDHV